MHRPSRLARDLWLSSFEGVVAMPIVFLVTPGNFIAAALFTGLFKYTPDRYGLLVSLPFWANCLQPLLLPLLRAAMTPKRGALLFAVMQNVCWASLLLALPALAAAGEEASWKWLLLLLGGSAVGSALAAVYWVSWTQGWTPERIKGRYFGRRNAWTQVSQVLFTVAAGWVLTVHANGLPAFQLLIGTAVVLRVFSHLIQSRIVSPSLVPEPTEAHEPWLRQVWSIVSARPFVWTSLFGAAWGFATNSFGAFYVTFMYEELALSTGVVGVVMMLSSIGGAFSFPVWGRLADKFGNRPTMLAALALWQANAFLWCFVDRASRWTVYPIWIVTGVMAAGLTLCLFNLLTKVVPPHTKTLAISLNLAITSLASAIAPVLGGYLLNRWLHGAVDRTAVYHGFFLFPPVAALLAFLFLRAVNEPKASTLSVLVGSMRNIRTLAAVLGLGFLADRLWAAPRK